MFSLIGDLWRCASSAGRALQTIFIEKTGQLLAITYYCTYFHGGNLTDSADYGGKT